MTVRRLARWLDERVGASSLARRALRKVFPDHWSFMLGEIALYCFVVLVLTGIFLTFFFDPSVGEAVYEGSYPPLRGTEMSSAYRSVVELSFDTRAGLVMRQAHHWAAIVFIAAIVLHLCRIFFTGAFRRPRELNWLIGLAMLLLAVLNGFTGYSLPDDLLSGTGLRIAYSLMLSVPIIGSWLGFLLFGGEFPAESIISRLYTIHILIVPVTLGLLIGAHLLLVWRQGHTQFPGAGHTEETVEGSRLWPTYAVKSLALFFLVGAVVFAMGGLIQINPVWIYGPFDAAQVTSPAQPDWYMGWAEGALRLAPPWEITVLDRLIPNPFFPGVLVPGLTLVVVAAWPFLEARMTGDRDTHHLLDRPRERPGRAAFGAALLAFYGVLLVSGSNDIIAARLGVDVGVVTSALRWLLLVLPLVAGGATAALLSGLEASGSARLTETPLRALLPRRRRTPRG